MHWPRTRVEPAPATSLHVNHGADLLVAGDGPPPSCTSRRPECSLRRRSVWIVNFEPDLERRAGGVGPEIPSDQNVGTPSARCTPPPGRRRCPARCRRGRSTGRCGSAPSVDRPRADPCTPREPQPRSPRGATETTSSPTPTQEQPRTTGPYGLGVGGIRSCPQHSVGHRRKAGGCGIALHRLPLRHRRRQRHDGVHHDHDDERRPADHQPWRRRGSASRHATQLGSVAWLNDAALWSIGDMHQRTPTQTHDNLGSWTMVPAIERSHQRADRRRGRRLSSCGELDSTLPQRNGSGDHGHHRRRQAAQY